jgi:hypothetical protein
MKRVTIIVLLFYSCVALQAQKIDTLTQIKRECKTAEGVLGLTAAYTVLKCNITITRPDREVLMCFYGKDGTRYCLNANSANFAKLWSEQVLGLATKGSRITINNIIIKKGDEEKKLVSKTFVVP